MFKHCRDRFFVADTANSFSQHTGERQSTHFIQRFNFWCQRNAIQNIKNSVIDELVVTDTIPLSEEAQALGKIRQVSVASMVAETIRRINNEESISAMFDSYL
jgi:phosphoribosylpyrophosphate synthetase